MAHRIFDRAQQLTTSTGAGALVLGAVPQGMLGFADQSPPAAEGDTFWGTIFHLTAAEVETTLCTYHADGTITRAATPLSSTTGAKIAFSAGTKTITCVAPASKSVIADPNGLFEFPGPIATKGQRETVAAPSISAGVLTLDLSAATVFKVALTANVTTLTLAGAVAGFATSFILELTADGTARAFTMPGNVTALDGPYTPSSTNGKRDRLIFETDDGGTTWLMGIRAQNY